MTLKWNGYKYVRCVRGGQYTKVLNHLAISVTGTAQQPAVPFPVTMTAKKADGSILSNLTGYVELASILGRTDPERVYLVFGQWSGNVTIYNPGTGALSARGLGLYGASVPITTGQSGSCTASIQGRVIDLKDDVVYQATVQLLDLNDQVLATAQTDLDGEYDFGSRTCGTYRLNMSKDTATKIGREVVTYANNQCAYQTQRLSINGGTQGTPVILVPGILGSSKSWKSVYPKLSKKKGKHNLHIHAEYHTGFHKLKKDLEDFEAGEYTVFECPWDWRMRIDEAVEEYLKPKITEALKMSTTGRVHIVAHSMGGLVVRSLIQGSQSWADKIDRFVMVGTPNRGSVNAYYIWEGGDPKLIDDISDSGIGSSVNFYSNTLQNLWEETYNRHGWSNAFHKIIRKFVHEEGPSLLELMSTENFLNGSRGTTGDNRNTTLDALNSDSDRFRMSSDGAGNTIETGLFIGQQVDTVTEVKVKSSDASAELWQDGEPYFPKRSNMNKGSGDGTVPYTSAVWPVSNAWARLVASSSANNHGTLVKGYVSEIISFLSTGAAPAAALAEKSIFALAEASEPVTPSLSFTVAGTVRLDVTDPAGNHAGIDPVTGDSLRSIPGSLISFDGDDGEVGIDNPLDGTYQVVVFGAADRDFHLDIGFRDAADMTENYSLLGYYGSDQITFQVVVNSAVAPRVTVVPPAVSPANLQADPIGGTGAEITALTWDTSTEAGVNGYNVYAVTETAPYYTLVATVTAVTTSYTTADPWAGDAVTPVMTYAVTVVKTDGSESFFPERAQNNDRDHDLLTDVDEAGYGTDPTKPDTDNDGYTDYEEIYAGSDPLDPKSVPTAWKPFPWTMFLPAIIGAGE